MKRNLINEVRQLQKIAGILKEDKFQPNDPVKDVIEGWYWKTNPYIDIDDLSPEEIERGIQDHYNEWNAVKDQYSKIEDYFEDVVKNGDWY
jgi:hypothetical protein